MRILLSLFFLLFLSTSALADVVLTMETSESGSAPSTGKMFISGKKMRMSQSVDRESQEIIFRGDKDTLITVMPSQKKYMEITKSDMAKMGNKVNDAMNKMQAQMSNLPPEQQKMMKQMMGGMMKGMPGGGEKRPPAQIINTGKTETVSGHSCNTFEVKRGGETTRSYCVVEPSAITGGKEARAAFEAMGEFFGGLIESMSKGPFASAIENPYAEFTKIKGIPFKTVEYKNGQVKRKTVISSVAEEKLAMSTFEPPEGFARQQGMEGL